MQTEEQKELWKRIQDFAIDDPSASIKYSDKLAANNHWSGDYAARVVDEYKKFMFLCCVLPAGASPSKPVDEAWHLHLTYTHNYWKEFCGTVLKKEIHHNPSKGGTTENHKYDNWYADTLDLYRKFFGYNPPEDIWPAGISNSQHKFRALDALSHINSYKWLLPVFFIPVFVTGFLFRQITPFNLTGPQFLLFYALLAITTLVIIYLATGKKSNYIEKFVEEQTDSTTNIFQLSRFVYSREQSIKAAVVDLTARNILEPGWRSTFTFYPSRYEYSVGELNPLLPTLLSQKQEGEIISFTTLRSYYDDDLMYTPRLSELYQSVPSWDFLGIFLTLFTTMIGVLRIIQGASNERPYSYLLAMVIVYVVVSIILLVRSSERTILKSIFRDRFESGFFNSQLSSTPLVNSFVFAGLASVSMMVGYDYLQNTFARHRNNSDWSSSSGCGSSGGNGSGSDGGGSGCGSSGCGGCGGGGD